MSDDKAFLSGGESQPDRIPVLNTPATPQEADADAPAGTSPPSFSATDTSPAQDPQNGSFVAISDDEAAELAEAVLDRLTPVLHDALIEVIDDYLAEHDEHRD
ncbi:MAG: hypothetical protein L0I62_02790 [Gammaproteobacteria bacterium]|nr:hypothetical protein [Gammaproteobacteria bacterium]